ncbi:MAG: ATP-binding protein [Micrococcales bacterium]|nr:ATP-binding protein [Micrococcales bacterium]
MADDRADQTTPYDASAITVLSGREAVRKRPGMYIGATGQRGLHHLVYEVVDHSEHEVMAGCADEIHVTLLADGGVRVVDDGCGIPVDLGPEGKPAVEVLMTELYYGAMPDWATEHAQASGAPYRIWLAVVNALSERLEVEVRRQGHVWRQSYHRGIPDAPLARGETTTATGTTITFWADPEIFSTTVYDADVLRWWFRQLAFLVRGLHRLTFIDERDPHSDPETFSGGLADYIVYLNRGGHYPYPRGVGRHDGPDAHQGEHRKPIHSEIIVLEAKDAEQRIRAEIAMQWTDSDDESLRTFVNTILTSQGGTHAEGFRKAVTSLIAQYAKEAGLRAGKLGAAAICQGLTAVVNVTMADPHFAGPTAEYLDNAEVKTFVQKAVTERFGDWLTHHPDAAETIARHAVQAATV